MEEQSKAENTEGWVWVIIYEKAEGEGGHYLGLYNEKKDINFIPAFESKEAANDCFLTMPREKGKKYEVQAIHIEELMEDAKKSEFAVAIVDSDGAIAD
jgi:hypothetical protein